MPTKFPLLLLPTLVLNRVLKLVTLFELVAISLCSKKSKMICKSARSQLQCKNGTKEFTLKISLNREIRLKFYYYPRLEWVFKLECFPKINNIPPRRNVLQKIKTFFCKKEQVNHKAAYTKVMNDLFINTWIPTEDDTTSEHSLQLFTTEENQWSNTNSFTQHLSDILNVPLWTIELHFQDFIREENERIIDFYCCDNKEKLAVKSLTLFGKDSNTSEDDAVVDALLCRQEVKVKLKLLFNPTSEFKIRTEYVRNNPRLFESRHSHWISFQDAIELKSFVNFLFNSSFNRNHLNLLIEKWNNGWSPEWVLLTIEFCESVDIDECVNELRLTEKYVDADLSSEHVNFQNFQSSSASTIEKL